MIVCVGGRRLLERADGKNFTTFNVYLAEGELGTLITGYRITSDGQILAPVKWNPKSRKFFNTTYVSEAVGKEIARAVQERWPDLVDGEVSSRSITYEKRRFDQLLPDVVVEV